MQLGEVALGGVGSGLYGMLVFVLVAVFVAGLMVGRTPEYLGKKIEPFEMKMAALLILIMPIVVLGLTALAVSLDAGKAAISNPGRTGSARCCMPSPRRAITTARLLAGWPANTPFYNFTGALAMFIARFWLIFPPWRWPDHWLPRKRSRPVPGHSHTSPLFIGWLILVVLLVAR